MVTINETGRHEPPKIFADDEDDIHDGWGPIRPRRSSMPPDHPHSAHAAHAAHDEHDLDEQDRDTIPLICLPKEER
jgi:hypothetical protein